MSAVKGWSSLVAISAGMLICAATSYAVTIAVDGSRSYQTMEGMGAMNRISNWNVRSGPFYVEHPLDNFYDSLINVMGFTCLRPGTYSCDFSTTPGQYDMDALKHDYNHSLRLQAVAQANNEPFFVIPSLFSPPAYMKFNNLCHSATGESTYPTDVTNSLMPENYAAYGEFCAVYVSWIRDSLGLDVYAFSFQNEPYFNQPYASSTYSGGQHYAQMLRVAGPILRAAAPTTLIYGVEHMTWAFPQWETAVRNDALAEPYLDRYAVHGYTDGVQVDTSTFDTVLVGGRRPVWMTETGGACETHADGMTVGRTIMRSFNNGVSAWNYCGLIGGASSCGWLVAKGHGTYSDGTPGPAYWAHAHFARFARPGWKRISSSSSNSNVMVSAYSHAPSGGLSIVLINTTASTQTLNLSISGIALPAAFEGKLTTASEGFADMGAVSPAADINMPGNSFISLGYGHRGTSTAIGMRQAPAPAALRPLHMRADAAHYDIAGRRLSVSDMGRVTQGAYGCVITVKGNQALRSIMR